MKLNFEISEDRLIVRDPNGNYEAFNDPEVIAYFRIKKGLYGMIDQREEKLAVDRPCSFEQFVYNLRLNWGSEVPTNLVERVIQILVATSMDIPTGEVRQEASTFWCSNCQASLAIHTIESTTNLNRLASDIYAINRTNGFWDNGKRNAGESLMLIVSELSEALEADRKDRHVNLAEFEEVVNSSDNLQDIQYRKLFETHLKDRFETELADTLIRLLDYCGGNNIPIEQLVKHTLRYNKLRGYKHGKKY